MSTSTERRREEIVGEVYEKGRATIKSLAKLLAVSEATVRRDLKSLAEGGQVQLVYGGATVPRPSEFSFRSKSLRNIEAKRVIGRLAAELVRENEQIFVDSGTTCFQMARHLKRKRGLTVIANSARLAMELDSPRLSVILLGGQYRPDRMDVIGPLTTRALMNLRGYKAFIGSDGLSMDFGLTASDIESANMYALAVSNASEAVLLVDHSKFDSPSLHKIVELTEISRVVTDARPSDEWMEFLAGRNVEVIWPDESPQQKD